MSELSKKTNIFHSKEETDFKKINSKNIIKNVADLEKIVKKFLPFLQPNVYLLLQGNLGIGKTTFAQMIARKLKINEPVNSPTFNILQQYTIKGNYKLNHFDFFRLSPQEDLSVFRELTVDNLNIIEWPEKNPQFWQGEKKCIHLAFSLANKKNIRTVEINSNYLEIK